MIDGFLSSKYFYKILMVVVIANLASLFLVYQNMQEVIENQTPSFASLSFGESIEDIVQEYLKQQGSGHLNSNVHVIVFIDLKQERYLRILSYLDLVRKRHLGTDIQFDVILPVSEKRTDELKKQLALELNMVSDLVGDIYDLFDVRHGDGGILVLKKESTVKFVVSPLPPEETIRQMVEVCLYDKSAIAFKPDNYELVTPVNLGNLNVYNVLSGEYTTLHDGLSTGYKLVTIFDGFCPNCVAFDRRIRNLKRLVSMYGEKTEFVFVFKTSASEFEIRKLEDLGPSVRIYQTNDVLLPDLEYIGREEATKHFRTLLVDSEFNVLYFENHIDDDDMLFHHINEALKLR